MGWAGIILKTGKWQLKNDNIICEIQTIHRTFKINLWGNRNWYFSYEDQLLKKKTKNYFPTINDKRIIFILQMVGKN